MLNPSDFHNADDEELFGFAAGLKPSFTPLT